MTKEFIVRDCSGSGCPFAQSYPNVRRCAITRKERPYNGKIDIPCNCPLRQNEYKVKLAT